MSQVIAVEIPNSKKWSKILHSVLKDRGYLYDAPFLKEYGCFDGTKKYKLTIMKCVKNSLVEFPKTTRSQNKNDIKLENNLQRSRSTIFELAFCNKWDFFFTGTLDKKKCNREDLAVFQKKFKKFIYNFNQKFNCKVDYLLIPELHSDLKSWHFHGFVRGIPLSRIYEFKVGDRMGKHIAEKVLHGVECFYWCDWLHTFGFNDIEPIRNYEAVSKYVTKYITKDLIHSVKELNAHSYYCSTGLKRALQISAKKIDLSKLNSLKPDFVNEYCSIRWLDEKQYKKLLSSSR